MIEYECKTFTLSKKTQSPVRVSPSGREFVFQYLVYFSTLCYNICITNHILEEKTIMTKIELIAALADKADVSKKDAAKVLDALTDTITEELAKKEKVTLVGFGTFETRERAARTGKNPRTGEALKIAASVAPVFKAGKALKDAVNAPKKGKKK